MTDEKKNNPRLQSSMTSFPDSEINREQAEQKARAIDLPDLDTMTHEEIRQMIFEMQVRQIEADLLVEQLRNHREEREGRADLFSIVTENMLDIVALTDMESNFLFARKSHQILGYEPGFLIGKNVMDFVHPEDLRKVMGAYNEPTESGDPDPLSIDYRCRYKDGNYLWIETRETFF